jgi:hypothetical protein
MISPTLQKITSLAGIEKPNEKLLNIEIIINCR